MMRPFLVSLSLVLWITWGAVSKEPGEIAQLIDQLGSVKFPEREKAYRQLKKVGPSAYPFLLKAEKSKDAEIASRAKKLLIPYYDAHFETLATKLTPTKYPRTPWLWTPENGYGGAFNWVINAQKADKKLSNDPPDWTAYRVGTRLYVLDMLKEGRSEKEIVAALDGMARAEIDWIRDFGKNYVPPILLPVEEDPDF